MRRSEFGDYLATALQVASFKAIAVKLSSVELLCRREIERRHEIKNRSEMLPVSQPYAHLFRGM